MAVDAGVHLGAITQILKETQPPDLGKTEEFALPYVLQTGPFAGFEGALRLGENERGEDTRRFDETRISSHILTSTTYPDSSSTQQGSRARGAKLAGLPATIQALKTHIFNNVIWPNLSDEDHGAGLFYLLAA
ncbi:hypothetical protein OPQ81_008086 [Rhizoctonia solani]|nr:hypothetical protein OPQ81_008086 [Rhizoctonia solani]